jgi:hypothetical protein
MEKAMRRLVLATAATLAILAAGSFTQNRAEAMTVTTPTGLQAAIEGTALLEDVAVACRRVWRCGPYGGCGSRRVCWGTAPYYGGYGYYGYGGPYYGGYYRPWRRYWW